MPNFKNIRDYSKEELNSSVEQAEVYCQEKGLQFYKILNGIDAYFERRRRREEIEAGKKIIKDAKAFVEPYSADWFGEKD